MDTERCECGTPGYFISNDDPPTLQRCDTCAVFPSDDAAYLAWARDGYPAPPKHQCREGEDPAALVTMVRTDYEGVLLLREFLRFAFGAAALMHDDCDNRGGTCTACRHL